MMSKRMWKTMLFASTIKLFLFLQRGYSNLCRHRVGYGKIWEDLTKDFIEGLPESNNFDTIFVVVDRLSKYSHFIPLKHPFIAKQMVAMFVKEIVRLHGFPCSIVLDREDFY